MRLNYKPLGNYIKQIKKKNTDGSVTVLKGIRINKEFMESVANIQGTDLSRYRVVEKYQFAYNPMHVGRDEILPISLLLEDEPIIVSPAYVIFEILDHNVLNPEYLMMWCRRSEFDRNVWFTTDSSVRGGFSWESLCELELPIPSIEKQNEIVAEYNTIVNRIKLNETLNQKLEDTAQALYKHWFVDFNFPIDLCHLERSREVSLESLNNIDYSKCYKSSGGEMVYNEELDLEIPMGWEVKRLDNVLEFKNGKKKPGVSGQYSVYGGNGIIDFVNNFNSESIIIVGRVGAYCGSLFLEYDKCWVSDNAISGYSINDELTYCLYLLQNINISERREGTGQPLITQSLLNEIQFVYPSKIIREVFNFKAEIIQKNIKNQVLEIEKLRNIESLLLSKMSKADTKTAVV
ncbi:restriction endonuclease subunit S [Winogradskyella sp. SM1960]|uniref:restriction endonuclease subunit S n=1 Tax=Winogradskyella sp. SM1960 TaxID=2865955 RepID=UPI001CD1E175|nr:restriction endonuclease subunit S [Winogradskyella sp. SM1960]